MIKSITVTVKPSHSDPITYVETTYKGTEDELTSEFLSILEDGLDNNKIRLSFNKAFTIFNNNHPLNLEVNND